MITLGARRLLLALALAGGLPAGQAAGQEPAPAPEPGAELSVALVTVGPGARVWERFGHNLIWVRSTTAPLDSVWDWGRFQFDEGFFLRFARADLRYWMQGAPGLPVVQWYAGMERRVVVHELALSPPQRRALLDALHANDTDAARYYQYHYYLDNCSTRIRDALDRVLGGAIRARTDTALTPWSYRDQTKRLNQHNPFLYFGLTTLLAGATDRKITAWEEMFLPEGVERWVREIEVAGPGGARVPLVAREEVVAPGGRYPVPDAPSRWWPGFLATGVAIGALLAGTGRSRGAWRRGFLPAAFSWLFLAGILGVAMVFLWGFSGHQVAWRNENLLQFNLLPLMLLPVLPASWDGSGARGRFGRQLSAAIAGLALAGVALKAVPGFAQANWDVMALAVPAHAGLWLGIRGGRAARA